MGSTRLTGVNVEPPPEHVLVAFGLAGAQPILLGAGWEGGWRCGEVVLSMVADTPARPGRPGCARRCSSTAYAWLGPSDRPTAGTWCLVGGQTRSSPARRSLGMMRSSRRRCGCMRPPENWNAPDS